MRVEAVYWLDLRQRIELFHDWIGAAHPDFGSPPFQVVGTLKAFRDAIAHGKPFFTEPTAISVVEGVTTAIASSVPSKLSARWEHECTKARFERNVTDVESALGAMKDSSGMRLGEPTAFLAVLSVDYGPSRPLRGEHMPR